MEPQFQRRRARGRPEADALGLQGPTDDVREGADTPGRSQERRHVSPWGSRAGRSGRHCGQASTGPVTVTLQFC